MQGRTYREVRRSFADGLVCGHARGSGCTNLIPEDKDVLLKGDELVVMAHTGSECVTWGWGACKWGHAGGACRRGMRLGHTIGGMQWGTEGHAGFCAGVTGGRAGGMMLGIQGCMHCCVRHCSTTPISSVPPPVPRPHYCLPCRDSHLHPGSTAVHKG